MKDYAALKVGDRVAMTYYFNRYGRTVMARVKRTEPGRVLVGARWFDTRTGREIMPQGDRGAHLGRPDRVRHAPRAA